jgi:HAMP domain-containing protein
MPDTVEGKHLLRQIRIIVSVILIIVIAFATVVSITISKQSDNIDKNSHNVNALTAIVSTTRKDAHETRVALEKALAKAKSQSDPSFTQRIEEGLQAIKRIEAKLNAGG